jgi:hypothetical protein
VAVNVKRPSMFVFVVAVHRAAVLAGREDGEADGVATV